MTFRVWFNWIYFCRRYACVWLLSACVFVIVCANGFPFYFRRRINKIEYIWITTVDSWCWAWINFACSFIFIRIHKTKGKKAPKSNGGVIDLGQTWCVWIVDSRIWGTQTKRHRPHLFGQSESVCFYSQQPTLHLDRHIWYWNKMFHALLFFGIFFVLDIWISGESFYLCGSVVYDMQIKYLKTY